MQNFSKEFSSSVTDFTKINTKDLCLKLSKNLLEISLSNIGEGKQK